MAGAHAPVLQGALQSGRGYAKSSRNNIENTLVELIEQAKKTGDANEIRAIVSNFDELKNIIERKNFELDALESLAMESDNPNVVDLREQLFTTVKLIHSKEIEEIIDFQRNGKSEGPSDFGDILTNTPRSTTKSLFSKIRESWYRRRRMRNELREAKRSIRRRYDREDSDSSFTGDCASAG